MKASAHTRTRIYVLLALAAVAAGLSQAAAQTGATCPDLGTDTQLWSGVIQACTNSSTTAAGPACGPCHCALVNAVTPRLQQSGAIPPSEMYTATAVQTLTSTLASCMRDFAVQVLENTDLKLTQLLSMEVCVPDVRGVTQCLAEPAAVAVSATQQSIGNSSEASAMGWADLVQDASCALATGASAFGINTAADTSGCKLSAVASNWLDDLMSTTATQGLTISATTTRTPVSWKADCWCEETYDPVCDPKTRIQYPNPCSAECQYVASTVPCYTLHPLVNRGIVPGSSASVMIYDESLYKTAQQPVAFSGPPSPTEADDDKQLFYYYYEDDVDDTQDAIDMAAGFVKAMMAANLATEESAAAAAISTAVPAAIQAGAAAAASGRVAAQDGAADSSRSPLLNMPGVQRVGGLLASLMNSTAPRNVEVIARVRSAVRRDREAKPDDEKTGTERRTTVGLDRADDAVLPSWLSTKSPDQTAGVYIRNPDRTSRILAALMAAARESSSQAQAASIAALLGSGLQGVLNVTAAAAKARQASVAAIGTTGSSPMGDILRAAEPLLHGTRISSLDIIKHSPLNTPGLLNAKDLVNATLKAFDQIASDTDLRSGKFLEAIGQAANTTTELRNATAELRSRANSTLGNIAKGGLLEAGLNVTARSLPGQVAALSGPLQSVPELAVKAFNQIMNRLGNVTESLNGVALGSGSGNLLPFRTHLHAQDNSSAVSDTASAAAVANSSSSGNTASISAAAPETAVPATDGKKEGKKGRRLFSFEYINL